MHMGKIKLDLYFIPFKWTKDLDVKSKTFKSLQENILYDLEIEKDFFRKDTKGIKHKEKKTNKFNHIEIMNFYQQKIPFKLLKDNP